MLPTISDIQVTFKCCYPGGEPCMWHLVIKKRALNEQLKDEILKSMGKVIIQGEKERDKDEDNQGDEGINV